MIRKFGSLAAIMLASVSVSQAQPREEPVTIGGVTVGMDFDKARAAFPNAAWAESQGTDYFKTDWLKAPAATKIYGDTYDIEIGASTGGDSVIFLNSRKVAKIDDCVELGMGLFEKLEAEFGVFDRIVTIPDYRSACFNSSTMFCANNIVTLKARGGSEVLVIAKDSADKLFAFNDLNDGRIKSLALGAQTDFGPYGDSDATRQTVQGGVRYEAGNCLLRIELWRDV